MHDIRLIREKPADFDAHMKRRKLDPVTPMILALDEEKRNCLTHLQELQSERNTLAKNIAAAKQKGEDASQLLARSALLKEEIPSLEQKERELDQKLMDLLCRLPNALDDSVPEGKDETDNQLVRTWGSIPSFSFTPKRHFELGESLNLMDFERAAKISGARFVVLKADLARLERALGSFMLDLHTNEFGYMPVSPPCLVKDEAVFGVGQLPKFEEDLFKTTDGRWLISTAEVSLTNLVREEILDVSCLPLRFTAATPCFRSEAGAAGKDTRGMIRQHQFQKVELVSITHPDQSDEEHERMTKAAETVLQRLELPYRIMLLCSGDTGNASCKTYDLEVWLPGENLYREISSCSNTRTYQARRMNARFREKDSEGKSQISFVHTLNGSGLAIGRTLVAILENYQQEDGSIRIPTVLRPYMGNQEFIKHV